MAGAEPRHVEFPIILCDRSKDRRPTSDRDSPNGPTDMREPANKSLLTDVSGLRFHSCTIIPTHALPQFLDTPFLMLFLLTWDIRGLGLWSSRLVSRHASSPRVWSGPRARRSSCSFISPVGACGTTGRFTAPAAPAWFGCGQPVCRFRGTRAVAQPNAEDRWAEPGRRKQIFACVPHANGLCGLLHVPGVVTGADAPLFVRAVARTCTWTVRPCCRRLSPSAF